MNKTTQFRTFAGVYKRKSSLQLHPDLPAALEISA